MITNRILEIILGLLGFVVAPIQLITTFILGILIHLTFGLLLFPLSFVWNILFLYPLIGLSYVYEKATILRAPIAIIGIPIAILGNTYASLIPSMGDMKNRCNKLIASESFPYTWHYHRLSLGSIIIKFTNGFDNLLVFFDRIKPSDVRWKYVNNIKRANNI
ncbi:hypothetical protein J1D01_16025 [Seonamhaeicola sp. NFXS20]|uniref:hypothetical protein n=1 Tax=Seonamhaeicola sp. NFXS20 TaxID=2816959 RepID=UPI003B8C8E51